MLVDNVNEISSTLYYIHTVHYFSFKVIKMCLKQSLMFIQFSVSVYQYVLCILYKLFEKLRNTLEYMSRVVWHWVLVKKVHKHRYYYYCLNTVSKTCI